ncbi:hypothetical protein CQ042_05560 [Microbacterium sp. MYb62]|nr:hypothetical protein CQ042_05560 [Microbacterium sp. MYb62]
MRRAFASALIPLLRAVERESVAVRSVVADQKKSGIIGRRVLNAVTLVLSAAAVVVAAASLAVAIDTSTRDHLAGTFIAPMAACVTMGEGMQIAATGNVVDIVITNTGRLPITIVNVWNGDNDGDHFSWARIEDSSTSGVDVGVELNVGQAIAVRVFSPGGVSGWPLIVLTSDGVTRELHDVETPAEPTTAIESAYAALPECSDML